MEKENIQNQNTEIEEAEISEKEINADIKALEKGTLAARALTGCLSGYLVDLRRCKILTKEEEDAIWAHKTPEGIQTIIEGHLRMVVAIVNKILPYDYRNEDDFMDLIQAGNMGLMKATQSFNPSRGAKFSTHAYHWITTYVKNELAEKRCGPIKKPAHILAAFATITKVEQRLELALERKPTSNEIVVALDGVFPEEKVRDLLQLKMTQTLSLDMQYGDDEDSTLADYIGDDGNEDSFEKFNRQSAIDAAMEECLDERLRLLICARYGLGEFEHQEPRTLGEVSELLVKRGLTPKPISKERIRQLEERALELLRNNSTLVSMLKG